MWHNLWILRITAGVVFLECFIFYALIKFLCRYFGALISFARISHNKYLIVDNSDAFLIEQFFNLVINSFLLYVRVLCL